MGVLADKALFLTSPPSMHLLIVVQTVGHRYSSAGVAVFVAVVGDDDVVVVIVVEVA